MVEESLVVQVMRQFKLDLLAREQMQMQEMAQRWLQVENALDANVAALAREFDELKREGKSPTRSKLYEMDRYHRLLNQLQDEIQRYEDYADRLITEKQIEWGATGIRHASTAIQVSYEHGVGAFFDRLPIEAIEIMAGLAGDGSPLRKLLEQSWPEAADAMTEALVRGTALGWNPRKTAKFMRDGLARGLDRTLTIARTEQIRVYREASRQQYEYSGVVEGYYRLVAHDDRTCAACLMAEGEFYHTRDSLRDHPNGRCSTVPKVIGMPPLKWQKGPDWFLEQDEATQMKILGKSKFEAWRQGKFDLDQLVTVKHDATWGASVTPTPLRDLVR